MSVIFFLLSVISNIILKFPDLSDFILCILYSKVLSNNIAIPLELLVKELNKDLYPNWLC